MGISSSKSVYNPLASRLVSTTSFHHQDESSMLHRRYLTHYQDLNPLKTGATDQSVVDDQSLS
jgi:hypothetical protein